jgi:hypothetical protein
MDDSNQFSEIRLQPSISSHSVISLNWNTDVCVLFKDVVVLARSETPVTGLASSNFYRQTVRMELVSSTGPWWLRTSEETSSRILVPVSKWVNEVGFTHRPLHPRVKIPCIHWVGGWVHLRTGLYAVEKTKFLPVTDVNFFPLSSQYHSHCTTLAIRVFPCYSGVSPLIRKFT